MSEFNASKPNTLTFDPEKKLYYWSAAYVKHTVYWTDGVFHIIQVGSEWYMGHTGRKTIQRLRGENKKFVHYLCQTYVFPHKSREIEVDPLKETPLDDLR